MSPDAMSNHLTNHTTIKEQAMTATTTIQESPAIPSRTPLWAQLAFVLAGAAIGSIATVAVVDDDDASPASERTESVSHDSAASTRTAVTVSADAAEARRNPNRGATEPFVSADAAERRALDERTDLLRSCT